MRKRMLPNPRGDVNKSEGRIGPTLPVETGG